ncbi:MAG TPA: aryl-sulfate sulfotransferase [Gemmataceae bacterium]|nr:aryl-sulfate sulfotransferase [Gemmataceae bacterium]
MKSPLGQRSAVLFGVLAGVILALMLLAIRDSDARVAAAPQDKAKPDDGAADKSKTEPAKPKSGLILNEPRAYQGYTLLAPIMSKMVYLLDMEGRVVRTWEGEASGNMSVCLLENGHLLRYARLAEQTFGDGAGAAGHIQEFTFDGELVWDYRFASTKQLGHHDIFRMPNGNVLMIVWDKKSPEEAVAAGRRPETVGQSQLLVDCIYEIKPTGKTTGKVVWEWHVWDHLIQDHDSSKSNFGDVGAHPELVDLNFGEGAIAAIVAKKEELEKLKAIGYIGSADPGRKPAPVRADWMHSNAVAYNAELDQVLLNVLEFNEFWIIDHSTTSAEAAGHTGGKHGKGGDLLYRWGNPRAYRTGAVKDQKLFGQHNTHWIPKGHPGEGHLLIFNNGRSRIGGAYSSVDELELPAGKDGNYEHKAGTAYGPDQPVWSYSAPKRSEFSSGFISGANRLPNGNTFICSGANGTIFEVTPEKEIVWKYVNPAASAALGGPASRPRLVELMPAKARETLKLTDEQNKQLDALQPELETKLAAILTDEQNKLLKEPPKGAGGPNAAPQAIRVLPPSVERLLKITPEQKKVAEELQKEADARLAKILTADQAKQLKDINSVFVNAWGPGGSPNLGNAVYRSYRYAADYPGLKGRDLKPGKSVEELQAVPAPGN